VTKERYIHSSFYVVFCPLFHVHHHGKNIFNNVYIHTHTHTHTHMTSKLYGISLSIRKLQKNTLLYPIIGRTKTRKLVLTIMKIKYNALVLRDHIIQFFTRRYWRCNIPFNSTYKKSFLFFFFFRVFLSFRSCIESFKYYRALISVDDNICRGDMMRSYYL